MIKRLKAIYSLLTQDSFVLVTCNKQKGISSIQYINLTDEEIMNICDMVAEEIDDIITDPIDKIYLN